MAGQACVSSAERDFFRWVATRRAHQNPRGDFIRDTRYLVENGRVEECAAALQFSGDPAALAAYEQLRLEWKTQGKWHAQ